MNPLDILQQILETYNVHLTDTLDASNTRLDSTFQLANASLSSIIISNLINLADTLGMANDAIAAMVTTLVNSAGLLSTTLSGGTGGPGGTGPSPTDLLSDLLMSNIADTDTILQVANDDLASLLGVGITQLGETLGVSNESLAMLLSTEVFRFGTELQTGLTGLVDAVHRSIVPERQVSSGGGNDEKEKKKEKGEKNLLEKALSASLGKLAIIFGPLIAFTTLLHQASSGFSVFIGAINVLASSIAPLLLPGFVLLAALLVALSAVIWEQVAPALKDFYTNIMEKGIVAIQKLADTMKKVAVEAQYYMKQSTSATTTALSSFATGLIQVMGVIRNGINTAIQRIIAFAKHPFSAEAREKESQKQKEQMKEREQKQAEEDRKLMQGIKDKMKGDPKKPIIDDPRGKPPEKEKPKSEFMPKFFMALDEVMKEMKFQSGSKAGMTGLVQASRSLQVAALSKSPFEQKMLERMNLALLKMNEVIVEMKRRFGVT